MKSDKLIFAVWILSSLVLAALTMQPVGTGVQLTTGLALLWAMILVWMGGRTGPWRLAFIGLALTIAGRYVYWRTTSTLPSIEDPLNFIPGFILYVMEMFTVLMLCISLFIVADPIERAPAPRLSDDDTPTVDVFIPTYNEDKAMLATTVSAALAMDYPAGKLKVYLLDDGGTDQKCNAADPVAAHSARSRRAELMALCEELGAHYLTRERNLSAKAGNMNAALPKTSGELIAIFDADHGPVREFLTETVGHFHEDPRLFLVQTPHFFLNPDPIEKNLSTFNRMPSENEMFYGIIQKGLDKWNGAFFCGSAAVISRAALEEAGGFDGVSITEDCETALSLHARGWNSRYVDKPLIAGLQPETFASFIGQRSRWCSGMMQILLLKNPLFKRGLSGPQRIAYLSSSLFWLFPLTRLTFIIAPLLYTFFSMEIYEANISEFIAYTTVYMAANMMMQNYLYGKVRWPWMSELYEYVQSVYLVRSIFGVLLNPRKPTFNVTAKGQTLESKRLSELALPYFVIFAVLVIATVVTAWRWYHDPAASDLLLVVGLWNLLNLAVAGLALGVVSERVERRHAQRLAVSRRGAVRIDGKIEQVLIEDVSAGGAKLRPLSGRFSFDRAAEKSGHLAISPAKPGQPILHVPVTLRRLGHDDKGVSAGIAFTGTEIENTAVVASIMYANGDPLDGFRQRRRNPVGVLTGTLRMLGLSLHHVVRGISYLARIGQPDAPAPEPSGTVVHATVEVRK
ncbi:UDP-forming cellulose synthase catalytic subunit [Oryzibacter oryziterrae]|uniref:UDP-forming cellulose synthase catalytic subunit n=1 Tax=Oryzibacter oryziterrae TaxID=2766474 RepID=UPI002107E48E|nr:UDP-forming cellulose synthase catalytic subunit [Oryzibacter oryziterrae]